MPLTPPLLAPPPRSLTIGDGSSTVPREPGAAIASPLLGSPIWKRIDSILEGAGLGRLRPDAAEPWLRARITDDCGLPAEGYELKVTTDGVDIVAAGEPGLRWGLTTLAGLLHHGARAAGRLVLPLLVIQDRPDIAHRGLMLDVSRNKVPTMRTLESIVDLLAALKLNQLQLYTEHTFAYAGHESVWRNASPITPEEIRRLDRCCAERGIELVPNQNSFGHLHRWLVHEPYRYLAECPDGVEHAWSTKPEPFSLCPTDPASLRFLEGLYEQLLPNFSSRLFNVGLDETFDLGLGRSREACERRGRGAVYLDFLRAVQQRVASTGHRMMFWGDIVAESPEISVDLPPDAIAMLWGYESDHPFADQCRLVASSGLDTYVCPGTSSWNSFAGRWTNARDNCANAARAAVASRACGYLITDWGDNGHLQPLVASYPGIIAGACFSWNGSSAVDPERLSVAELLDSGPLPLPCGEELLALADVYRSSGVQLRNGTVPFRLLMSLGDSLSQRGMQRLERNELTTARARLDTVASSVAQLEPKGPEAELVAREVAWISSILDLAYELGELRIRSLPDGPVPSIPAADRQRLAERLRELTDERHALWLARNRPGGWDDSRTRLEAVRRQLVPTE